MEVTEILSQLIKIPSVNPPGGETKVAVFLKNLFDEAGISNEIIESAPGRGNFIASLGSGEKSLLFLSHADVVPAGEGWDFGPFGGEVKGGVVYGRGALDCKGLVAAEAQAMRQLSKHRLGGKLIFAATADEENGGSYGVKFLTENHPAKLMADFAINEGGQEPMMAGNRCTGFIQAGEKGPVWTKLKFRGISCHGAIPTLGDNAIAKASQAVVRLAHYRSEVKLTPEIKGLLDNLNQSGDGKGITAQNVDAFLDSYPDRTMAETIRSLTRMTISPNEIHGGSRTNIVPDNCEIQVDIRVLPGQDKQYVLNILRSLLGEEVDIEIPAFNPASFSLTGSAHYRLIERTMKDSLGEINCFPIMSAGATDSRFLRAMGVPCYGPGIATTDFDPARRMTVHARNESIDIKSLQLKVDFLVNLALNYLGEKH
ncbi:MAG: dimer protein [Dehalococcoidales bacterium]|nr:dimer protein [Dehalococcoidales bacterium]